MYKINILLKQDQKIFHTRDLAILWQITNPNTLYTTIKRYVKSGILIQVQKGLYSVIPLKQIDPVRLGLSLIHDYAYLSAETVLVKAGIIFQSSNYITLISNKSKRLNSFENYYLIRQMKNQFLYNSLGIEDKNGIKTASLERAVADLLYFNPKFYFDNQKAINWKLVKKIQKEVGFFGRYS